MQEYDHHVIETKTQEYWASNHCFKTTEQAEKDKFYCLCMFPYPSGRLHMGHVRNYTIGDVITRYQRMNGKNVLQPMGWDAFGLPAENAAIQNKVAPAKWTYSNIEYMKKQLNSLGFAYDWSREFATCDENYYRWEQWFFTRLYEKGLVYKKKATVNWDPVDQTVLANEQVIEGRGWRSGALVERKEIPQWFIKITDYAEELLNDLDTLDNWPQNVKTMQSNWIGRSKGIEFAFDVDGYAEQVKVYTTRPDTIMGVTYLAAAPQHFLATQAAKSNPELSAFIDTCNSIKVAEAEMATMDKLGMDTGVKAVHPFTGEKLSIWVANFVLIDYGSGAVMSVPGHDQRDWEFATKYGINIKQVIKPLETSNTECDLSKEAFVEKGLLVNSGKFNGLTFQQAFDAIAKEFAEQNRGEVQVNYRLRDWGVSRQRYWGTPIPMIYCDNCGDVPVPAKDLPVVLPKNVELDGAASPLKGMLEFYQTTCPTCGNPAHRETDTFDTFMESSWYYARFACSDQQNKMLDERAAHWTPVDQYIGGIEHAILHLLYARFFHKLMRDEGLVNSAEPFNKLLTQGMVVAETYYREQDNGSKTFFNPAEVETEKDDKGKITAARLIKDDQEVNIGGIEKMSKSKNNGVDPQVMIDKFGADTVRLFIMFASPPDQSLEWSDSGVEGAHRFLKRFWKLVTEHITQGTPGSIHAPELTEDQQALRYKTHQTIRDATNEFNTRYSFNKVIALVMELTNTIRDFNDNSSQGLAVLREAVNTAVLILAPITPHICHYLWLQLGNEQAIINARWPEYDEAALVQSSISMVVQVNGKVRGHIDVPTTSDNQTIEKIALENPGVQRFTEAKTVRKIIIVPNKLVSVVVS